ncbi:hypothetical protein M2132_002440 [Dysgonomonas sp. PH5-45]|uniref:hypothetical protein n=1 Tax=unclassified Dysgonomonas TaxID=2630389 RepID=UPI0024770E0F|nr:MULTISPECIES: hypothetical protein [unclassified Dysgonomonas]MDH6356077.1 hypothetical protein [Dysgonomonas sp. PH5-45]MDH6388970.1 hypothetical protein [Dysgonomonas sp. PH5-37]
MKIKIIFFIIPIIIFSCKEKESFNNIENINISTESVFTSSLKTEVVKMIKIKKSKQEKNNSKLPKICSVIISSNPEDCDSCFIIITLTTRIDVDRISGYTFLENELIACYLLNDLCSHNVVKKENLYVFNDFISGYSDLLKSHPDAIYETPIRRYQIVGKDSLHLIKSAFIE